MQLLKLIKADELNLLANFLNFDDSYSKLVGEIEICHQILNNNSFDLGQSDYAEARKKFKIYHEQRIKNWRKKIYLLDRNFFLIEKMIYRNLARGMVKQSIALVQEEIDNCRLGVMALKNFIIEKEKFLKAHRINFDNSIFQTGSLFKVVDDLRNKKNIKVDFHGDDCKFDVLRLKKLREVLELIFENSLEFGKNAEENVVIHLSTKKKGEDLSIEIEDEGAGVDINLINSLAITNNLHSANAGIDSYYLLQYLFLPEFTTTNAMDRGMGLDLVLNLILSLGWGVKLAFVGEKSFKNGFRKIKTIIMVS